MKPEKSLKGLKKLRGKRVLLEPLQGLPKEAFVHAGAEITEPLLREAKMTSDKTQRLLRDLDILMAHSEILS